MHIFDTVFCRQAIKVGAAALAVAGITQAASASLIDVNFYSAFDSFFDGVPTTATGAAVVGSAGDTWNGINGDAGAGGPISLVDVNGNATPVTLSYNANLVPSGGAVTASNPNIQPNASLMTSYLFNNNVVTDGLIVVSLGNLTANTKYDLFIYLASNDASGGDRDATVTANGTSADATGDPQTTFIAGENYVELATTSDASGNISITEQGLSEVDMNGLQLVLPSSAVPEPTTMLAGALLLLPFGVSALRMLRKKQTA